MKWIGGGLLLLSGLLWGWERARGLCLRTERLTELLGFMQFLRTQISFSAHSLCDLLHMGQDPFCVEAEKAQDSQKEPIRALDRAGKALLTDPRDRELFHRFIQALGASDTQGQLEHLGLYMALVQGRLDEAKREQAQKSRLYLVLGIVAGLSACILFL